MNIKSKSYCQFCEQKCKREGMGFFICPNGHYIVRFEGNQQYIKLTLKDEYSKTAGRVISLYWKNSLEAIQDYLYERRAVGIKSTEPIFA